jgi:hypothetical protein
MQEEKNIKELLEGASLQDLAPDFDRDEVWAVMQERMPQAEPAKQKRVWLGWYSHAAAVVLGILLTYGFFSLRQTSGNGENLAADYNKRRQVAPRIEKGRELEWRKLQRSNDSLKSLLASLEQTQLRTTIDPEPAIQQSVPAAHLAQQQAQKKALPAPEAQQDPIAPQPEEIHVAANTPAPKLKVTHYMDVENEDQSIMVRPAPVVFEKKLRLRVNKPESKTYRPEQSILPLRELFTVSQ